MKTKRRIDDLGRIVIPKEVRKALGAEAGDEFNIELDGLKVIITKTENACAFCGKPTDYLIVQNLCICKKCANIIVKRSEKT